MPERIEQLLQFPNVGLYLTGPKRGVPRTALRRALGIHEAPINSLRARQGENTLYARPNIISLGRLDTDRFQSEATILYKNNSPLVTGLNGSRLTLQKSPPSQGLPDYLFVSGGGVSRKISPAGAVTNWGISPPADGLAIAVNTNTTKQIERFEDHTTWTYVSVAVHVDEPTVKQEGTNSLHLNIVADTIATVQKALAIDLSVYASGALSPLEDNIEFWVRLSSSPGFDYILIRFDVGAGNFATDYYQFKVFPTQDTPRNDILGIGTAPNVEQQEISFLDGSSSGSGEIGDAPSGEPSGSDSSGPGNDAGSGPGDGSDAVAGPNTWTHIKIPKKSFFRSGASTKTWADVAALQFTIKSNSYSTLDIFLDDLKLVGAVGTQGRYRYHSTFRNTTTGNRSNPEPTFIQIDDVQRQSLAGTSLQISGDTQVDQREVWRTIGNGTVFFRALTVDNNVGTTFTDTTSDYIGLNSLDSATFLEPQALVFDNAKPDETYTDFVIDATTAFWLSNDISKRGRLYYSPLGRPEGVKGFITVTSDNDILQRIIIYNGLKYLFSLDGVYRIDGSDPYTKKRVTGVPGVPTANKRTVCTSPVGIWYQADDGIRLFDGATSTLVFYDRLGSIFRGETLDYFPPFEGIYAAYFHNQYYISNGIRTLCINQSTQFIRELGIGLTALLYEEDTQLLIGALPSSVSVIENESSPIFSTFDIETGSLSLSVGNNEIIKRIRFKGSFSSQEMTPTLILNDVPIILPPFTIEKGSVEYTIGRTAQSISVRLQSTLAREIELEAIEVDIYTPYSTLKKASFNPFGQIFSQP